jgi:hypothetical protein
MQTILLQVDYIFHLVSVTGFVIKYVVVLSR